MAPESNPWEVEARFIVQRSLYLSILVMQICTIIRIHEMLSTGLKTSQADVWRNILLISILPVVLIHHLMIAFFPVQKNRRALVWVIDIILLVAESCFIVWILIEDYAVINPLSDWMSPYLVLACYALLFCLVALIALRLINKNPPAEPKLHVIFGRRILAAHYHKENGLLIGFRAFLTISVITFFPFYFTYNVVVRPLQSKTLMTVRESRSLALPPDFKNIENSRWNVVITNFPDRDFDSPQQVQDAINAISVFKQINDTDAGMTFCNTSTYTKSSSPTVPDHISFNCLNATQEEIARQEVSGITSKIKHFVIGVLADYNDTVNSAVPLMHVRIGLTDDTVTVIRETRPAILGENQNMVGQGEVFVRRGLTTPWLTLLGMFTGWKTYLLTDVDQYFNDPDAATRGYSRPGISTIIMNMENARYGYRVIEDNLDKTVLDGLSAFGGLFALIGSTAALLFGRSIVQVMFDLKPLSIFGFVHKWDGARHEKLEEERITEEFEAKLKKAPQATTELLQEYKTKFPILTQVFDAKEEEVRNAKINEKHETNVQGDPDEKKYIHYMHKYILEIEAAHPDSTDSASNGSNSV